MVEFALVTPILLLMIFGIVEFGRVYWTRHTLEFAAEETGRYALAHPNAPAVQLGDVARANLPGLDPSAAAVTVSDDTVGSTTFVTIVVSWNFDFHIPFVDLGSLVLTGSTRVPLIS